MYDTGKNFYLKNNENNNVKNIFNYKDLNRDNYNKFINTQTIDMFSHTQSNFMPKTNNFAENFKINSLRKKYRDKSMEDNIVTDNNNEQNTTKNNDSKNFYNKDKVIRAFKTNNRIYVKPKHNAVKSLEKIPTSDQNKHDIDENKEKHKIKEIYLNRNKEKESNNNIDTIKIKVKRGIKDSNKFENNKENNEKILEKMRVNKKIRNNEFFKSNDNFNNQYFSTDNNNNNLQNNNEVNRVSKGNIKTKLTKKKYSYNLNDLNIILDNKRKKENVESKENKENNIDSNFGENSPNSLVFKKKNLKNSFYTNYDKKNKRNYTTMEHSQFEIIQKNKINITHDENNENKNYEESNDDSMSVNTTRTLTFNKSMKHFYSRYPRKMNRTKTKRSQLNDNKNEEKKEKKKLQKLKKEKSEILQSLKVLLKKKDELEKEKEKNSEDEEENESEEKGEENNMKNKYKTNNNYKPNNILKKKENYKEKLSFKDKKKKKDNNEKENNYEEEKEKEYKPKNNSKGKKKKKLYVHQSQDFLNKEPEKDSFRAKYKKKNYKYSEI